MFPKTTVQTCIVHLIRASLRYVPRRHTNRSSRTCGRSTPRSTPYAAQALDAFDEKWGAQLPPVVQMWRESWDHVIPFLCVWARIRRVVYTTNAIEALNRQLRKAIKTKGSFPSEDAARN